MTDKSQIPWLSVLEPSKKHSFIVPIKKIHEGQDVSHFLTSKAYGDIMILLLQLNRSMFPQKLDEQNQQSEVRTWDLEADASFSDVITRLRGLLNKLDNLIDEVPPDEGPRRFGNVSFRKWYQKVEESTAELLSNHFPPFHIQSTASAISIQEEVLPYFLGSFGSAQRLDYGSGHELSFLAFLGCIWKLGGFQSSPSSSIDQTQSRGIVLGVFADYFRLIRRLIETYNLEPAGSHGVWGLDDHSFLPYIFGSAQYGPAISDTDQTPTEGSRAKAPNPGDVAKTTAVRKYQDQNLYFGAIGFIHDVKRGPFWEHSPMLYDISGVTAGWGKINKRPRAAETHVQKGMIKMYAAEVLGKFPVVQHFPFGSLFSWETDPLAPPAAASVHTSSQPALTPTNAQKTQVSRNRMPSDQEGMRAPWAASAAPASPRGTAPTAAPWASARPQGAGDAVQGARPGASNTRESSTSDAGSGTLPPTRAP